ncbi:hypothetical protein GCM10010985_56060 [Caballeronia grimmiae]|uniref:Uncharacterized protein n=1 Tax=Caballeronia grimmiae TaxID=1071679 RepID=A0ABQ1S4U3_9BURK|nr:hypothetical protein GCM10010985_56060 [Caballeronia grimmiae]
MLLYGGSARRSYSLTVPQFGEAFAKDRLVRLTHMWLADSKREIARDLHRFSLARRLYFNLRSHRRCAVPRAREPRSL